MFAAAVRLVRLAVGAAREAGGVLRVFFSGARAVGFIAKSRSLFRSGFQIGPIAGHRVLSA